MEDFDAVWDVLARKGKCDARGGAEYKRCAEKWRHYVRLLIIDYILTEANRPAPWPTPTPAAPEGGAQ